MGMITLEGDPPFHLGPVQDAEAQCPSRTVEVIVTVFDSEPLHRVVPIQMVLELEAARKLQAQLVVAITVAEMRRRQR
jgi:hypothetical protein